MHYIISGHVTGWYSSTHLPHKDNLAHLRLHKRERERIAGLLAMGVPVADVVSQARGWGGTQSVSPLHLLRRQDVYNIACSYHVAKKDQLHPNDAESVAAWVERNAGLCRYVKWQTDQARDGLKDEDFMMIIMTDVQVN